MRKLVQQIKDIMITMVFGVILPLSLVLLTTIPQLEFNDGYRFLFSYVSLFIIINGLYTWIHYFIKSLKFKYYFPVILIKNICILLLYFILFNNVKVEEQEILFKIFGQIMIYSNFLDLISILFNGNDIATNEPSLDKITFAFLNFLRKCKKLYAIYIHINKIGLILAVIILLKFNYLFQDMSNFTTIFILFIIIFIFLYKPSIEKAEINIKISNIVDDELTRSKIYRLRFFDTDYENARLARIDFSKLRPEKSKLVNLELVNHSPIKSNFENESKSYFFVSIPNNETRSSYKLKAMLEYEYNSKTYLKEIIFYLEVNNFGFECLPYIDTSKVIMKSCPVSLFKLFNWNKNRIKMSVQYSLYNAIENSYYYESDLYIDLLHEPIHDTRKFLEHDGNFGIGKTSFDVVSLIENGRIPVIISPWEDHYDQDFLYLIYKKLKAATRTKFSVKWYKCFIYYVLLLAGIYTFIFANYDILYEILYEGYQPLWAIFSNTIFQPLVNSKNFVFLIAIPIFAIFIFKFIIADLVVFKRDHTKVYQDFYIEQILNMISTNPNMILLIEDVDRLSIDSMQNIFRTISAINKRFIFHTRVIGVLSYCKTSIPNDSGKCYEGFDYSDIENKIIYNSYAKGYNFDVCKEEFVKQIINYTSVVEEMNVNDSMEIIEHSIQEDNFRTIHQKVSRFCSKMAKNTSKDISEIERIINESFEIKD